LKILRLLGNEILLGTLIALLTVFTAVSSYQGALADAICGYIENEKLRRTHGEAARKRVSENFRQEVVWENLYQEYVRLIKQHFLDAGHPVEPENEAFCKTAT
jgi:hypothetical protein